MTGINGETVINMTMKQLLGGVGAILAGTLTIGYFLFGGVKSDIADIRTALTETQSRNADTHQSATSADSELRAQIAGLVAELKITNTGLTNLTASVAGLDQSIKSVDARLATSVVRQEGFERWVVARLGQDSAVPPSTPIEWQQAEGAIIDALKTDGEPLTGWYKLIER
jgi:hypothetical protein